MSSRSSLSTEVLRTRKVCQFRPSRPHRFQWAVPIPVSESYRPSRALVEPRRLRIPSLESRRHQRGRERLQPATRLQSPLLSESSGRLVSSCPAARVVRASWIPSSGQQPREPLDVSSHRAVGAVRGSCSRCRGEVGPAWQHRKRQRPRQQQRSTALYRSTPFLPQRLLKVTA